MVRGFEKKKKSTATLGARYPREDRVSGENCSPDRALLGTRPWPRQRGTIKADTGETEAREGRIEEG